VVSTFEPPRELGGSPSWSLDAVAGEQT
jgi:hypothetical protein